MSDLGWDIFTMEWWRGSAESVPCDCQRKSQLNIDCWWTWTVVICDRLIPPTPTLNYGWIIFYQHLLWHPPWDSRGILLPVVCSALPDPLLWYITVLPLFPLLRRLGRPPLKLGGYCRVGLPAMSNTFIISYLKNCFGRAGACAPTGGRPWEPQSTARG